MHYINGVYTNYINRKRSRSGHLLQGRYKAILINQDNYLLKLKGDKSLVKVIKNLKIGYPMSNPYPVSEHFRDPAFSERPSLI